MAKLVPINNFVMKSIFLILALIVVPHYVFTKSVDSDCYSNKKVENTQRYKKGNYFQRDLLLFVDMIKNTHPAFAPGYEEPFNIDSIGSSMYMLLGENGDLQTLDNCVSKISARLKDGHTLSNSMSTAHKEFYPLGIFIDDSDDVFVIAAEEENAEALGKQIVRVNGYPTDDVVNYFKSIVSAENNVGFRMVFNRYFQRSYFWETAPFFSVDSTLLVECSDDVTIKLLPKKEKVKTIVYQNEDRKKELTIQKNELFSYQILEEESICYLQFNKCYDYNSALFQWMSRTEGEENLAEKDRFLEQIKEYPKFDEFLARMFDEVETKGVKTLVVDVRYNGGGNSRLCNQLLSYLTDYKKLKSMGGDIRVSELFRKNYPMHYADVMKASKNSGVKIVEGNRYDMDTIYEENMGDNTNSIFQMNDDSLKIFRGDIFFLQSKNSYSSTGLLLLLVKQNGIGVIVGEKSSFSPCRYGDMLTWKLPNTGITGYVSHKYFTSPDRGMCDYDCLCPDVVIETTLADFYNGDDRVWEWILKNKDINNRL